MDAGTAVEPATEAQAGKKGKRFQCEHCDKRFARLEHLQRHERIHSGVKPFSCAQCNYSFTRSDLLVRHERLTHKERSTQKISLQHSIEPSHAPEEAPPRKRTRTSFDAGRPVPDIPGMISSPAIQKMQTTQYTPATSFSPMSGSHNNSYSLTALSMAAEYQALQGNMANGNVVQHSVPTPSTLPSAMVNTSFNEPQTVTPANPFMHAHGPTLDESLNSLASFLDNEPLDSYQFATLMSAEQPMPFFSPDSLGYNQEFPPPADIAIVSNTNQIQIQAEESYSLSRFGSRFPSLQPDDLTEDGVLRKRPLADVSHNDRQLIIEKLKEFSDFVPSDFKLPTRLALCRYIAAYVTGFHEHMPFLHIPTMSIQSCSIELILALAAVGAQYTFEGEKGVELFGVSRSIATQRIRRRDMRLVERNQNLEMNRASSHGFEFGSSTHMTPTGSVSGPLGLPSEAAVTIGEDLMQTAQALLLLMALCTWAKHKEILREALAIQSVLATLIRDDGLQLDPLHAELPWLDWVRRESIKRTKFIVYGFSNLHCIVYNIPPFMLTFEVKLTLPCSAAEFKASTTTLWMEARKKSAPEILFQDALKRLFSKDGQDVTLSNSSSGNYALVHALIQHVFFLRQVTRYRFDGPGDLSTEDIASMETALRNWQIGWRKNSESSLDPMNPDGPVAFNSTALLRLAYIRLYVDTAGRALETRDPELIANAFRAGPAIKRSSKITRAVLHSAHALSIPIKMGYRLVAKTQSFIWSIQHSLCTLECAYLMSKWLEALSVANPDPPPTEDEQRIIVIVKNMLDETEFAMPLEISIKSSNYTKHLSAGVLRVWAMVFKGSQTWAIVDVIGSALNIYADMLETG